MRTIRVRPQITVFVYAVMLVVFEAIRLHA